MIDEKIIDDLPLGIQMVIANLHDKLSDAEMMVFTAILSLSVINQVEDLFEAAEMDEESTALVVGVLAGAKLRVEQTLGIVKR